MDRASVQQTVVTEGLESTLVVLRHRMPAGVVVMRDYAPDTPAIEAIPAELNQVWTNLITNALDAMAGEGTLRLTVRPDQDGVVVEVVNSGTWDDADSRERAFEPFFTTKGVGQGTGLGLDISRRIVVGRHGGDIGIDLRRARPSCGCGCRATTSSSDLTSRARSSMTEPPHACRDPAKPVGRGRTPAGHHHQVRAAVHPAVRAGWCSSCPGGRSRPARSGSTGCASPLLRPPGRQSRSTARTRPSPRAPAHGAGAAVRGRGLPR